jgi:alkylation response protein AidB-like acyl-CoA dehydrogenase
MECYAETQTPAGLELSDEELALLRCAQHIADTVLEPRAEATDRAAPEPPADNLRVLAEAGLLGITTPREFGGLGCSGVFLRAFTETITAACGTTWFLLTQHLGACGMVAGSGNEPLKARRLRPMAAGRHLVGVAFGHLRRPDPMLRAEVVPGGYRLTGVAPWVTGWPLLAGVIFGAVLPDARHVYVYAPTPAAADGTEDGDNASLCSSPPLPLCAMGATATTEVRLRNFFVPDEHFIKFSSREEMARGDKNGIAGPISAPLGCARASLKLLRRVAEKRNLAPAREAADALEREIDACRAEGYRWADGPKDIPGYKPGALRARTWAIELGVRAAHMAVAASSGAANSLDHPAQRLLREAMFYTVTAQTRDILGATLSRLSGSADEGVAAP